MREAKNGYLYMDREDVLAYVKNRPPILMVEDAYVKPGECIYSDRVLKEDEWFFACHFPGNPMMPGVLMLESMFNLSALAIKTLDGNKDKTSNISRITNVQFKRHILPNETMRITVDVERFKRGLGTMHGEIRVDDEVCCEADFVLVVLDDVITVGGAPDGNDG